LELDVNMRQLLVMTGVCAVLVAAPLAQGRQAAKGPLTKAERTAFNETSTYDEVVAFMREVAKGSTNVHLSTFGYSVEGRPLPLAVVGAPEATPEAVRATGKLRVHIQGNIHGGEVEGKEAAQMLLRDLAQGRHRDWLERIVFIIAPIYNADGNERFALNNRGRQFGPMGGQGQRPNAQGFDLNRDHMKLDSPEARSFARLMTEYDPHVSMDLHTTNGTRHAYHLTYSPPLNPATDPGIVAMLRERWLPGVTKAIEAKYGWHYYYYGNLQGRSTTPGAPDERGWWSFDHRPRFNNNYIGLRNRFAILSEAFAYASFEDRVTATSRFIDEVVTFAHANAAEIRKLTAAADARTLAGTQLSLRAEMTRGPEMLEVLLGEVEPVKHPVDGHMMEKRMDVVKPEKVADYSTFASTHSERVPSAYYVPASLAVVLERLAAHGVRMTALKAPEQVQVEEFQIAGSTTSERPFQGRNERTLTGSWVTAERKLPAGTLRVEMTQPLARLAFYLLEPRSDDGLVNWALMDDVLREAKVFPIVRSRD
jgi:hypothetical protein